MATYKQVSTRGATAQPDFFWCVVINKTKNHLLLHSIISPLLPLFGTSNATYTYMCVQGIQGIIYGERRFAAIETSAFRLLFSVNDGAFSLTQNHRKKVIFVFLHHICSFRHFRFAPYIHFAIIVLHHIFILVYLFCKNMYFCIPKPWVCSSEFTWSFTPSFF